MKKCPNCGLEDLNSSEQCDCGFIYEKEAIALSNKTSDSKIKCPFCAEEIQSEAIICRFCNRPLIKAAPSQKRQKESPLMRGCFITLGLFLVLFLAFILISDHSSTNKQKMEHDEIAAYVMANHFVSKRLSSPGSAKYPIMLNASVKYLGDGRYKIQSYVDSQNAFGALVRTNYDCTVKWIEADNWRCESLEFVE